MVIRQADVADVSSIAEVHVRSWLKAYRGLIPDPVLDDLSVGQREKMWREAISRPASTADRVWVAEQRGRIVGFASAGPTRDDDEDPQDTGEIYAIYLEPEAQGQGIRRRLFRRAVEGLREQGFRAATLWVLAANFRTRLFYEAAGWLTDGTERTLTVRGSDLLEARYRLGFD